MAFVRVNWFDSIISQFIPKYHRYCLRIYDCFLLINVFKVNSSRIVIDSSCNQNTWGHVSWIHQGQWEDKNWISKLCFIQRAINLKRQQLNSQKLLYIGKGDWIQRHPKLNIINIIAPHRWSATFLRHVMPYLSPYDPWLSSSFCGVWAQAHLEALGVLSICWYQHWTPL